MPRPRRILYILEATVGGTREHILQILRGLDRARFQPTLLCSLRRNPDFADDIEALRREGIEVVVAPMEREIRPLADLRAFCAIVRHLRARRYDAVHTHSSKAGFLGRAAARLCGARRVFHTPHVYYFQWRPQSAAGWFFRALELFATLLTDRVIAVSPSQRRVIERSGVVRRRKLVLIENGIEARRFADASEREAQRRELGVGPAELLVGMVGRLEPQKGCEHFIRAAALTAAAVPEARFVLVGGGGDEPRLRALAASLGLAERMIILGHRLDSPRLYQAMDLFVLTSLWEGMPYVILEAMASGLAVVATDVPGSRDLARHGLTGRLVPAEDDRRIAADIIELLRAPELRNQMGNRARELVAREYSRERFLRELTNLYAAVFRAP